MSAPGQPVVSGTEPSGATPTAPTRKRPKGPKLGNPSELLFRQVIPQYYVKGELDEAAFRLTPADDGLLSISLESKTTAKDAYELHTGVKGRKSVGVWAVSVKESNDVKLDAYSDPTQRPADAFDDPAHGCIDFQGNPKPDERLKRKQLVAFAEKRGSVYLP
jgi:hypothetical protein